jgi:hypothetical protein
LHKKLERTASFPKKSRLGILFRRMILRLHSLRAAPAGAASKLLLWLPKNREVQFGALCLKMRESSLGETDAPSRRRSLTLAAEQNTLYIFCFARDQLFQLRKRVFCSALL